MQSTVALGLLSLFLPAKNALPSKSPKLEQILATFTSEKTQRKRQQKMTDELQRQREDRRPIRNTPAIRRISPQIDHAPRNQKDRGIHVLEVLRDAIHADKEARGFEFLGSGGPLHVDAKEMAKQSFGEVEGDPREVEHD